MFGWACQQKTRKQVSGARCMLGDAPVCRCLNYSKLTSIVAKRLLCEGI